ncbi:MAG: FG-GAP-like repeat-containing protein [Anaerolineae bacterium]
MSLSDLVPEGMFVGTSLILIALLLALGGAGHQPTTRAAPLSAAQAPVLKWQHGGCYSSWCETGWYSSPAVADLDEDGTFEVIGSAYSIIVLDGATGELEWRVKSGYDRATDPDSVNNVGRTWPGIVVGDVDGDGDPEIVTAHGSGYVSVYSHAGYFEPGWPQRPSDRELRGLSACDLDDDGTLDVIATAAVGSKTNTWVYQHDGTLRAGWPQLSNDSGYAWGVFNDNAAIGDLDGDGTGEIVIPSDVHYICAYEPDGTQMPAHSMYGGKQWGQVGVWESLATEQRGWGTCSSGDGREERYRANFAHGPAAIADVNGDGAVEVVVVGNVYDCIPGYPSRYNGVYVFNADRSRFNTAGYDWQSPPVDTGAPLSEDYNVIENNQPNPAVADLDGDGEKEILYASYDGRVHAFWLDKTEHGNWPYSVYDDSESVYRFASEPAVADLDNDGHAEVIFASWVQKGSGQTGKLHILGYHGTPLHEVDLPPAYGSPDWNGALAAPTLANIDADADLEVVLNTAHAGFVAYDLPGTANARVLWGTGRGNYQRTGSLAPCAGSLAAPGDAVVPGEIRADATFEHIGVLWWIDGDDDLDSEMSLEFRRQGESNWQPGAPAMRAYPTIRVQDGPLDLNYWAASALFLEPGQTYELRLTLTDPDGGGDTRTVTATTRTEPQPDLTGRQLYVVPGNAGGDGSAGNPFRGLQAAADAAQPGDVFHVAAGTYSPFELLTSGTEGHPITFAGPGDGTAIVDGAGTDRGVVTLGKWDQTIGHVIVEGLTIQNGRWGVDAQHSHDIVLRRNVIRDVDFGIYNRRGDAQEYNQTVCDNVIEGRTAWPGSGIPSERGIDLRGYGNVVCHNTVRYFGDCISVQPFTGPSYGNDVYGNDASYCVDDGIEIDYNQANARIWRNRVMNARMGVSVQPVRGGPAYIFRNELFNLESVPVKMHNYTTGFYVAHNTGAKHSNGYGDNGSMWRNAVLRNNLFLGTRYAFEFTTTPDEGFRDFDYNAWGTTREIGGSSAPHFKWDNVRYDALTDLPAGVEDHGVEAGFGDLVNAALPPAWDAPAEPGSRDLRLVAGAPQINAGAVLPNLNDPFVTDGQPDIGAFEAGQPPPSYGPRPSCSLDGDLDSDGDVDADDIAAVTVLWNGPADPPFDRDEDGMITVVDVMHVAAGWGTGCP